MKQHKIIGYNIILIGIIGILFLGLSLLFSNIRYGLDLQGGFEVLYEASTLDGSKMTREAITNTYKILQKRIDILGVNEPDIMIEGDNRIRVQLAGITNEAEAKKILSQPATLSFRDTQDNLLMTSAVLKSGGAKLATDQYGKPAVALSIKDKDTFYRVTKRIKDEPENMIVIWLDFNEAVDQYALVANSCGEDPDSKCLSAAYVNQAFADDVIIQGNFTKDKAASLAELINSGSIPTKLKELSTRNVNSMFGEQALTKTLIAGGIGVASIILLMSFLYHFAGFLAGVGIVLYLFIVFFIFWLIGGVLTLPGIASLVLGIGMAVDACIISFERIKEELKRGYSLLKGHREGYQKSLSAIIDANITTLIVALIMFMFGESSVKGFATMLIINIIVTIIVMVYIIRYLLKLFIQTKYFETKKCLFINFKEQVKNKFEFNFLKPFRWCLLSSILVIIGGVGFYCYHGLNLSTDYKGGTYFTLSSNQVLKPSKITKELASFNYNLAEINNVNNNQKMVYLKLDDVLNYKEMATLENHFQKKFDATTESGVISNIVKKELTKNALISILLAAIGIIIYVTFRFKFSFALVAIIPLLHDALMVLSVFIIFRIEIAIIFIAAILTIIGYSINDTVVIFDRIRENIANLKVKPNNKELLKTINTSIKETFTRSLFTTLTTLLPILALALFGTFSMFNFNLAIILGLIIGTYSSVLLASQIWYRIETSKLGVTLNAEIEDELEEITVAGINK